MDLSDIFNASSRDVANSVSYAVYPDNPEKCSLEDLELECMWLVAPLLRGYVWEREPFQLHSSCRQPPPWQEQQQQQEEECLWGSFRFGDNLEDEWFAVFLLRHISQSIADVSIQVWDDDGEFLLIEAAVKLPRWLKPDGAGNRVWLRGGELHIIPPRDRRAPVQGLSRKQALQALQSQRPRATAASADVKECIHNRMAGFPERARQNMHAARCLLPATAAAVLRKEPLLVGPAVHAFYLRDAQDMRAAARMAHFPPKDVVPVVVQFSRCMYALLQQQPYAAPKAYSMPLPHSRDHPPALLGLKLLTGMEILRSRASGTAHGTGQSAASCAAAGEDRPWEGARLALLRRGRLPQELAAAEGSEALARYRRLERYRRSCQRMLAAPHTIATLMAGVEKPEEEEEEEEEEEVVAQEDDDAWLYEGQAQLERELQLRERELQHPQDRSAPGPPRAVPEGDELDADELVRMMRRFVGVESGLEGAEAGSPSSLSDGEDSFSGESSCGEHEDTAARQLPAGDSGFSMMPAAFLSELERALEAMSAAEPPQTASGSCEEGVGMYGRDPEGGDGEAAGSSQAEEEEEEGREFEEAYAEALNWQLQGTKMAESFERVTAPESEASAPERRQDGREAAKDVQAGVRSGGVQDVQEEAEEEEEEEEDLRPVDVDMNLVKSLVESVSSQMGLPGPASNLSGMLGLNLHSAVAPAACAGTGLQQGPEDAGGGTCALGDPTTRNRPRPSHQQHPVSVLESRLRPASAANSAGVVQQPQQQADGSTSDMRSAAASGAAAAVNGGARSLDELLDELD